jgi:Flp pilus assembly protein TadG
MLSGSNKVRRRLGRSGVTSLEAALIMLPFLFIVLLTFDLARYLFIVQSMLTVMTDAERAAMIGTVQNCATGWWPNTAIVAPLLDPSQVYLCVEPINATGTVNQIQVTVRYPYTTATPMFGALNGTLSETTTYSY